MPWLKINGSCPVCRHSVNEGGQDAPTGQQPNNAGASSSNSSRQRDSSSGDGGGTWSFSQLLNMVTGRSSGSSGNGNGDENPGSSTARRSPDTMPPHEDPD
jgi:hypothetical protein